MSLPKLQTLILQELKNKPNSGYGLIKEIEQNTGWRPSYGSVHPQLKKLQEEELIQEHKEKNKSIWTLTNKGLRATRKPSPELIARLEEDMNLLAHICGADHKAHQEMTKIFLQSLHKGEQPFAQVQEELTRLQLTFWKLHQDNKVIKNKEQINKILEKTRKELDAL